MRAQWRGIAVVGVPLVFLVATVVLFGVQAPQATHSSEKTVTVCDHVDGHDFERILDRVERIKRVEMSSNVSICTESSANGIGTTPVGNRFAGVEAAGLALFELNDTTDTSARTSLGHISFVPGGNHVEVTLANERVVENVSWISHEALVAHELSDAIYASSLSASANESNEQPRVRRTTDYLLAKQAFTNGISMYVADIYVQKYGGHLNVTSLRDGDSNWKLQVVESLYYWGYRYASQQDVRNHTTGEKITKTAQLLHPADSFSDASTPERPSLGMRNVQHVRTDSVGELFILNVFRVKGVQPRTAVRAADGWVADRMDYYRRNGTEFVTWRTVWKDRAERDEFLSAYERAYDFTEVDSVRAVDCNAPGRYLDTNRNDVTIVQCPS